MDYPVGAFFRMVLFTGQRREEVARMAWADLDLEEKVWTIPAEMTKASRGHAVPLSSSAAKKRLDAAVSKARAASELGPIEPWTVHDLRRMAATEMARLGVSRFTIGRVLNHADRGVTGIYDQHSYLAEKRHALEMWGEHLAGLMKPAAPNVVAMRT